MCNMSSRETLFHTFCSFHCANMTLYLSVFALRQACVGGGVEPKWGRQEHGSSLFVSVADGDTALRLTVWNARSLGGCFCTAGICLPKKMCLFTYLIACLPETMTAATYYYQHHHPRCPLNVYIVPLYLFTQYRMS